MACATCWLLAANAFGQGTYTWNTTSGNWDTTTANWIGAGSTWVDGGSSNAVFNNPNGTVSLTQTITAGSLGFNTGGAPSGAHTLTVTGSNLSLASVFVWGGYNGNLGNGGVDSIAQAYDQQLRLQNMTANASGDMTIRRGMLYLNSATVNVGGVINSVDAWNVFREDSSTVTATGGIDFSVIASQVELYGGTVSTPFIKVGNAAFNGTGGLFLGNGVTLVPTGASADYLQVFNNGDVNSRAAATLSSGGMTLDTAYAVTIATQLNGGGSLTKTGTGALTLNVPNTYTGSTVINGGMTSIDASSADNGGYTALGTGAVTINNGGTLVSVSNWSTGNEWNGGNVGTITINNGGTWTINTAGNTVRNGLVLNGGTVNGTVANADWGAMYLKSTSVTAGGNATSTVAVDTALDGATTMTVNAGSQLNYSGVIHNKIGATGAISKTGGGTLVLSAANTYTGNTTVSAGTLIYQNTYASSGFAVASGAVLEIDVASGSRDLATTTFSGSGTLRKTGTGQVIWGPGVATFGFAPGALIDVQAGTFVAGSYGNESWSSNQSDLNVAPGAVFNTVEANVRVNTITGSGTILTGYSGAGYQNFTFGVNNGSGTFAGLIADAVNRGSIAKTGTGTVTLSGSNTYSGQTDITAGTLVAANNAALGPGGLDGNTMTFVRSGATLGLQGNISTDEHLHVVGTGVGGLGAIRNVSGDNTMTNWIGFDGNTTFGVDAGTLTFTNLLYGDGAYNASSLTKVGAGTLVLGGNNVLTGGLIVDSGTVIANRSPQDFNGDSSLGDGIVTVNNGGTLLAAVNWTTATPFGNTRAVGAVTINNGGTWYIQGVGQMVKNGLFLNGGTITGPGEHPDWGGLNLSSDLTASGSAVSSVSTDTALNGGRTITVDGGSQLNYSGMLHNQYQTAGAITKAGAGTLVLSGSNSYSGGTTLSAGTLRLESTAALGSGGLSMANGTTLQLRSDSSVTFAGGNGLGGLGGASITIDVDRLTSGGSGQTISFAPTGFSTYDTTINVTGGNGYTLALGGIDNGYVGPLTLNAVSANLQIGAIGGSSAVSRLTVGGAANTTINGAVATNGGLTKTGSGLLTLSGVSSSYAGDTTISSGTLAIGGSGRLGGGSYAGAIANAGALVVATSANQTLSGTVSGVGSLTKSGAGALTLTAANTFAGGVSLTAGAIRIGKDAALSSGTVTITGGGLSSDGVTARTIANAVVLGGDATLGDGAHTGLLTLTGGVDLGGATRQFTTPSDVTVSSVITNGGLTKAGAGTLTLTGSNTYSGGTRIDAGTLSFASGGLGSSGSVTFAGGVLQWATGNTEDISSRLVLPNSGAATLDVGSNDVTLAGGFGGGSSGGLTKAGAGTLTLTGSGGYSGVTTVSTGTLAIAGAGSLASSPVSLPSSTVAFDISGAGGSVTIGGLTGVAGSGVYLGGNTLVANVAAGSPTYNGTIHGTGRFTKAGAGSTLTLTSTQAFTGRVTVADGELALGAGNVLQSASSIIVGGSAGTGAKLSAGGEAITIVDGQTLGGYGTINGGLSLDGGAVLSPGGSVGTLYADDFGATWNGGMHYLFEVNDAAGIAGGPNGWDLFSTTGALTLAISGTDKIVIDLASLSGTAGGPAANFSASTPYAWKFATSSSEITFDPSWFTVDATNFLNLTSGNFSVARGDQLAPSFGGTSNDLYVVYAAAVPEPGALALAGIGLAAALASRRRRPGGVC